MTQLNPNEPLFRSTIREASLFSEGEDDGYQSLVENLSIGLVVHEASTKIRYANPAACQMLGLCKDEVEDSYATDPQWQFIEEDGSPMRLERFPVYQVVLSKTRMPSLVIGITHPEDPKVTWVFCDAYPELDELGDIHQVIVNFTDITQRICLEKELEMAKAAKSRFIDIAAHELKNPVAALSAQIELTLKRLRKGQIVNLETMQKIQRQTDRVSNLVRSLLDVSRLERNTINLKKEKTILAPLIQDCIQDFRLSSPAAQISFSNSAGPSLSIELDKERFQQVLTNLLDNANKYSGERPISVGLSCDDHRIRITVADEGEEIPLSIRNEIFKPFIRGDDKLKSSTPGLGLGLYICRSIIELHGGSIGFERTPDKRNVFIVELPGGDP